MESPTPTSRPPRGITSDIMLQLALVFDIILRTFIWTSAVAITLFWGARDERLFTRWLSYDMHVWTDAVRVARDLFTLIVVFNMAYLLMLMIVRLPIARIKSGHYRFDDPGLGFALFRNCILGALVRARYQPPFPAFLVPQLAGIVPFRWLLGRQFGPDTKSSFWGEPMILDPSLVKIGRNVLIGYGSVLTGHMVTRDEARVGEIIIEDDVLIGGYVGIGCDVHIGRGAAVGPGSFVLPGTRIGENEYWNGRPARRVRDVPDLGQPRQDDSPQTGSTNP